MATPKFFPVKPGDKGTHVEGYGRAMARHLGKLSWWTAVPTKRTWGWWHKRAAKAIAAEKGWDERADYYLKLHNLLKSSNSFDARSVVLVNSHVPTPILPAVPDLGPMWVGGNSVLDQKLTHYTSGIPLFPAFDDAFVGGRSLIAPEDMIVDTKLTSSNPGMAIYTTGKSGIRYWIAHMDRNHKLGTKFKKGQFIGKVLSHSVGGGSHVHVGMNVEALWGKGKQMKCGSNGNGTVSYTPWHQTVRQQLITHK